MTVDIVLSAISLFPPDLIIVRVNIDGFSVLNNPNFALLDQLNCPVIIARDFTIPGVHGSVCNPESI